MKTEQFWRDAERHVARYGTTFVSRIIQWAKGSHSAFLLVVAGAPEQSSRHHRRRTRPQRSWEYHPLVGGAVAHYRHGHGGQRPAVAWSSEDGYAVETSLT